MRANTRQVGSITTYIMTGVLLAVVLVGVAFIVVKRGQEARSTKIAETNKTKASNESSTKQSTSSNNKQQSQQGQQGQSQQNQENQQAQTNQGTSQKSSAGATAPLPTTGSENIFEILGLYLLTSVSVGYYLSCCNLSRSL